jgi:hypothetical protein
MQRLIVSVAILSTVPLVLASALAGEQAGAVVPKEKTALWNGKDFAGWTRFLPDPTKDVNETWSVGEGVVRCTGEPAGYMRTDTSYADYHLHVEWRWPARPGNSGVLIHMSGEDKVWPRSLECQLLSGSAGDFYVINGIDFAERAKGGDRVKDRKTTKLHDSSEKAPGEWNQYDIVCKDDWVVVLVNGVLQNVATKCSDKSGRVCLQSEGAPIEFRNLWLEPLE